MMEKLIIIGTGGFAAEAYDYINKHHDLDIQFLDDVVNEDNIRSDIKKHFVGNLSLIEKFSDCKFFIGLGDPKDRHDMYISLRSHTLNYFSFIHPTAQVSETAQISEGCFLYPFSILANGSKLGAHCIINSYSAVGHDSELKNFTTLSAHVDITGNVKVDEMSFFGSGARTVPNIQVSRGSRIGAGVVVLRSTKENDILMPNVAKKIKSKK